MGQEVSERELGLKNITEPPAGTTIQDTIEVLRRWQRWCTRMSELGGVLPDSALQVRALTKMTKSVLQQHPEVAFRVNLARASLQVDLTPDNEKVRKLHAQLLSELEAMAHRGDKDKERDKGNTRESPTTPPVAKVKGVEAPVPTPPNPKGPRPPRAPSKPQASVKPPGTQEQGAGKPPCTFYSGPNGCKKGSDCTYEHNWAAFPQSEKAVRCKNCGGKSHKTSECKAGAKGEDTKAKAKPSRPAAPPKSTPEIPAPPPVSVSGPDASQQHIKSLLADAALILQQTLPPNPGPAASPAAVPAAPAPAPPSGVPVKAGQPTPVQGTPVTLASLSAQLDQLRSLARDPEVRTLRAQETTHRIAENPSVQGHTRGPTLRELGEQLSSLHAIAEELDVRVCREVKGPLDPPGALLDSGATHAVIPYDSQMTNLEQVPVTLAGDARQNWWRTQGGTLVVPPCPGDGLDKPSQTILPLGALVETLGCKVQWSKRKGLRVTHPTLGILNTGISPNTCPYLQEDQALRLIAELESQRLEGFKQQVQNLECQLEVFDSGPDPTEALRAFSISGSRTDALRAFLVQPYLVSISQGLKVSLAESIPKDSSGA